MDFRALPPQRRQGIGRNHAGPDTRLGKRRSDRFAIFRQSIAIAVRPIDPFARDRSLGDVLSGCAGRKPSVIDAVAGEQAPGDPRILVGERDGDNVGVSPLPHPAKPQAPWILFFSNPPEHRASAMDQQGAKIAVSTLTCRIIWRGRRSTAVWGQGQATPRTDARS